MNTFKKTGWFKTTVEGSRDGIEGIIYEATHLDSSKAGIKKHFCKEIEFITDLNNLTDVKKPLAKIQGSWLKNLVIDGKQYW